MSAFEDFLLGCGVMITLQAIIKRSRLLSNKHRQMTSYVIKSTLY